MSKRAKLLGVVLLCVLIVAVAINQRGEGKMRRRRLFGLLLLGTILGLAVQSMSTETSAVNLQQTSMGTVMDDTQVLNATYPGLFNPNYTYDEFASVDLATVPRPSGAFTFRDLIISYYFTYDDHGIEWAYTQGQAKEEVLVFMTYPSSTAPSPHHLQLYGVTGALVAAKTSTGFAHAYLFLMQAKV